MAAALGPIAWTPWTRRAATPARRGDGAMRAVLAAAVVALQAHAWIAASSDLDATARARDPAAEIAATSDAAAARPRETFLAFYAGAPFYHRSDLHLVRPDGTDLVLKEMGWDGDALYFPIDGGVRATQWTDGAAGLMIDFLHDKAIARLGRGAHGRRLTNPVVEEVAATGTLKGAPAPARIKLTDVFERMEFTHGHNVLLLTPVVRLGDVVPRVRPYFGIGAGFALPHVEVWFPGGEKDARTNEYQFAGPAAQVLAGLEFRTGRMSYFVEYKLTWASISAVLSGTQSWMNFNMPGDMVRQLWRWWSAEPPKYGTIQTSLLAHQLMGGLGYWAQRPQRIAAP